jgi:hypothetical protein
MEGHELYRKWVALSDSTGKEEGVQGYLKLSILCMGPGDNPPTHNVDEDEEDDTDSTDLQSLVVNTQYSLSSLLIPLHDRY